MDKVSRHKKISIIGAGNVGATIAYTLMSDYTASEIVLLDINEKKSKGEVLDIFQSTPLSNSVKLYAGEYDDIADSEIVVLTVGKGRLPGQTRTELIKENLEIMRSAMTQVVKHAPNAIYLIVSNPVDILTYMVIKEFGIPKERVIGSGTLLDSARLQTAISNRINVRAKSINAYVFGEHGETSMVPWSLANVSGVPVEDYNNFDNSVKFNMKEEIKVIEKEMRSAGSSIISLKGATYYAIATSVNYICKNILDNTNNVIPLSTLLEGEYGIKDVSLSIPCIVGSMGIVKTLCPNMTPIEHSLLEASARSLRALIDEQGIL